MSKFDGSGNSFSNARLIEKRTKRIQIHKILNILGFLDGEGSK